MDRRTFVAAAVVLPALATLVGESRRVSCDEDDVGYQRYCRLGGESRKWEITCDGEPLRMCVTADPDLSYAVVNEPDANGKPYLIAGTNDVATRISRGDICVYCDGVPV